MNIPIRRIDDEIKEDSYKVSGIQKVGIRKAVMLTGDRKSAAEKVSGTGAGSGIC